MTAVLSDMVDALLEDKKNTPVTVKAGKHTGEEGFADMTRPRKGKVLVWFKTPNLSGAYIKVSDLKTEGGAMHTMSRLAERQRVDPGGAFPGEDKPVRPGAFKFSSAALRMIKKETGLKNPDDILFKSQKDLVRQIPLDRLPDIWNADNMADAQDVIARSPKKAIQMFLRNVGKVSSKFGGLIRKQPENIPILFYAVVSRVSGRDMADIILKRYFVTKGK
jgi:hypothetical protein